MRRTIRANLKYGGVPVELVKAKPRPHKNEHLFLNDISGSCEWISSWFFMLMFSAQTAFKHSRTFEFDNKVIETTEALKEEYLIDSFVKVKDLRVKNMMVHGTSDMYHAFKQFQEKVNLSNLFLGYNGAPRPWEISSIIGLGWGHNFAPSHRFQLGKEDSDFLSAKTGFDISYNFGDELEHQFYIEPAILWNLNRDGYSGIQMNKHGAFLQLALGYNYKFGCSYGGHNFKFIEPDRAEIDRLNRLLEECNNRPTKVEYVEKIVYRDREPETRTISIDNLKVVPFEQGKDYLTDDAKIDLNSIKAGSHVQIIGTASPEGSEERNQELSNNRANVVAEYLESRGVIVDSKEGRGVEGKTSNRLAIVYVIR